MTRRLTLPQTIGGTLLLALVATVIVFLLSLASAGAGTDGIEDASMQGLAINAAITGGVPVLLAMLGKARRALEGVLGIDDDDA